MRPPESFIAQPIRSLQTMLRVIAQEDERQPSLIPDGIYGNQTTAAVSAFQRNHGIPATGVADRNTWEQIVDAYEPALLRVGKATPIEILLEPGQIIVLGESNPYIYLAQGMLAQLNKQHDTISKPGYSGVLDNATFRSLRDFQLLSDLPPTGTLDRITWHHLVNQFTLHAARDSSRVTNENNL